MQSTVDTKVNAHSANMNTARAMVLTNNTVVTSPHPMSHPPFPSKSILTLAQGTERLSVFDKTKRRTPVSEHHPHNESEQHRYASREAGLDTEGEFDADVDVARHLDHFGELHRFLGRGLEVVDRENLEAGLVDLHQC